MEKSFNERVAEAKAAVTAINPADANQRKLKESDILFIDPRIAEDIKQTTGIIPGALNIPLEELSKKSEDALLIELSSRSRHIITSCHGGSMGALAAQTLKQRGYSNVYFIEGGTQGWLDAGFTTIR